MNEFISYLIGYGVPVAALLIAIVIILIGIGLSVSYPNMLVIVFLFMILLVPQASSYGTESGKLLALSILWVKGTKTFGFSIIDMLLVSLWIFGVLIANYWGKRNHEFVNPLSKWYLVFGLMFLGHILYAFLDDQPLLVQLSSIGVINVLKQGMFVSILFVTLRSEQDIKILSTFILICLALNEFWGLLRYVFLGGDPQNIYAHTWNELSGLKITFFDINEHILSSLMVGMCLWKLLVDRLIGLERFAYSAMSIIALLVPLLSSRRTAQFGLILSLILLFLLLPKDKRLPIVMVLVLAVPIGYLSLQKRSLDQSKSTLEKVLIDVAVSNEKTDPRKSRFYELQTAWKTIKDYPLFGVGPTGEFKVTSDIGLEYHGGNYAFVHSGFMHILLKTGVVGLFIYLSLYVSFIIKLFKCYKFILPHHKPLVIGCLCGFTSMLPTLQVGTPIIEIRTMLVAGFLFAIPLICISIGRNSSYKNSGKNLKL